MVDFEFADSSHRIYQPIFLYLIENGGTCKPDVLINFLKWSFDQGDLIYLFIGKKENINQALIDKIVTLLKHDDKRIDIFIQLQYSFLSNPYFNRVSMEQDIQAFFKIFYDEFNKHGFFL